MTWLFNIIRICFKTSDFIKLCNLYPSNVRQLYYYDQNSGVLWNFKWSEPLSRIVDDWLVGWMWLGSFIVFEFAFTCISFCPSYSGGRRQIKNEASWSSRSDGGATAVCQAGRDWWRRPASSSATAVDFPGTVDDPATNSTQGRHRLDHHPDAEQA